MYASSIAGNLLIGYLSDRYQVRYVVCGACTVSALACWLLWGFGAEQGLLVTFCLVWGVTALSSASAWSKMIVYISSESLIRWI